MNRDEIMSMQPGRELDALVCEKVMDYEYFIDNNERLIARRDFKLRGYFFHPSTDISAAWEVTDKIKNLPDRGLGIDNRRLGFLHELPKTIFDITPEAICKAALLSLIQEDTP